MPDFDIIDSTRAPGWGHPHNLLVNGDATPAELGRAVLQSLCRSLHRYGGLPGMAAIVAVLGEVMQGWCDPAEAFRQLRAIAHDADGHRHTRLGVRAAERLIVVVERGGDRDGDPAAALAAGFCRELIDHQLFGRVRPELVGVRFGSHDEARAYEQGCVAALEPALARVAMALVHDPQATALRTPRMPGVTPPPIHRRTARAAARSMRGNMGTTSPAAAYHIAFAADGCAHVEGDNASAKLDQRYFIGDRVIAHAFSARIPAMLADLVDVALAVYLGDRLVPRRPRDADRYHLHWNRRLRLTIPVRDPGRWRAPALQARLRAVLAILTEDDWAFDFVPKTGPGRPAELQEYLFAARPDGPITAALFSGGLDSFAGLCHQLAARPGDHFVLFCGGTNRRALGMQRALTAALPLTTGRSITSVIVPFGLRRRGPRGYDGDERTQRARGFVFQCLGAATALQAGVRDLAIYEPGIGALNLPYTAAQLGAQSTRATDPRVLAAMGDFISAAVGRPFHLRLPFFGLTKAELCASVREVGLAGHIRDTFSCDGFPQRVAGRPQCGICTSCLLRRQALHVAGLADYDSWEGYRTNVFGTEPVASARLHAWRAMHDQVAVLRLALADPDPWHGLCFAFPQLLEVAACLTEPGPARTALTRRIVALYRRYCDEWRELPTRHGGARAIRAA